MKKNDLLLLLISSFVLVIAWIGFSIYHSFANSTISTTVVKQIQPISPSFDIKMTTVLKARKQVSPDYATKQATLSAKTSPTPTIVLTTPPIATSSSTSATSGGTINP